MINSSKLSPESDSEGPALTISVGHQSCFNADRREDNTLATNASLEDQGLSRSNRYPPAPWTELLNPHTSHCLPVSARGSARCPSSAPCELSSPPTSDGRGATHCDRSMFSDRLIDSAWTWPPRGQCDFLQKYLATPCWPPCRRRRGSFRLGMSAGRHRCIMRIPFLLRGANHADEPRLPLSH